MNEPNQEFPGFPKKPATNYWPYPKALNGWWHILSGSEQKTLDYLLRHTWGYNKTVDYISYSQFLRGIQKKDDTWLDRGCGIKSSKTLAKALKGLMKKSFVEVVKVAGKTNFYILRIAESTEEKEEPLYKVKYPSSQSKEVGTLQSKETIKDITINKETIEPSSFKKRRPYFWDQEMRRDQRGQWWVIPKDGGSWLLFTGQEEEIEWK